MSNHTIAKIITVAQKSKMLYNKLISGK